MDIQYYGANCVKFTTKKASIVVDDNLKELGLKTVVKDDDIVLSTIVDHENTNPKAKLYINQAGEYELSDVSIVGIPTKAYGDEKDTYNNTIFKLEGDDVKVVLIGNSSPDLTDSQIEQLGEVNVLIIPVGGNRITLNGTDALEIIKKIEPQVVIPTHYADSSLKYKEPQLSLDEVIKELGMDPTETVPKLKLKSSNFSEGEAAKLVVLET